MFRAVTVTLEKKFENTSSFLPKVERATERQREKEAEEETETDKHRDRDKKRLLASTGLRFLCNQG